MRMGARRRGSGVDLIWHHCDSQHLSSNKANAVMSPEVNSHRICPYFVFASHRLWCLKVMGNALILIDSSDGGWG